jgi:hypothetical protein
MTRHDIQPDEHAPYYSRYIAQAGDLIEALEISLHELIRFVREIPMDKYDYRYAEGKWTIKDILQHLIDAERIFSYRALRFARKDATPLPGFEENDYAVTANGSSRSIQDLLTEFSAVRTATLLLYKSFDAGMLEAAGTMSGNAASVRALGFIMVGHARHHIAVFGERYLK